MAWRVKQSGAGLELLIGTREENGQEIPITRGIIGFAGQVIEEDLVPSFVERWEAGEEHARSLVDRLDGDGNVVGAQDDPEARADAAQSEVEAVRAELEVTQAELESAQAEIASLREQLDQPPEPTPETEPAGGDGNEYDPTSYHVEEVLTYLKTASPEEVDRVKKVEAASPRNSSQIAAFEPQQGGEQQQS